MSRYERPGCVMAASVATVGGILLLACAWGWYRAGVQKRVYDRQGIQMTQWEVFVGAEPAQKNIHIIPSEKP